MERGVMFTARWFPLLTSAELEQRFVWGLMTECFSDLVVLCAA